MKGIWSVVIGLGLLGSSRVSAEPPAAPLPEQAVVPIAQLVEVFQTNEIRAEAVYIGKEIQVSGRVSRVVKSRSGYGPPDREERRWVVELQFKPLDVSHVAVHFYFSEKDQDALADLKAGQEVVIQGTCGPLGIYAANRRNEGKEYIEVQFRNCKLVTAK